MVIWHPVNETRFVKDGDWCFANIVGGQNDYEEWVSCIMITQVFFTVDGPDWTDPSTGYPFGGVTHYMLVEYPEPPEEG